MTDLTIQRLGHLGDGIAEGPVFVPRTLPGEQVSGEVEGDRMPSPRIERPSADRVAPPCRHYKSCGGCDLQHASDDFVAEWKQEVVRQALAAHGLEAPLRPILTSPPNSRRRATFSAKRTKQGALVGFHARASATIIEIPDCRILHPDLLALRPGIAELAVIGASRKGEISVAVTLSEAGPDVSVREGKPLDGPLELRLAQETERLGLARLTWNGEVIAMRHPPAQRFGRTQVVPPPGAFLQATPEGEAALRAAVLEAVDGAKRVVDLFAGCGTFSLPLAEGADVLAVEGDAEMMRALDTGWRRGRDLHQLSTETRDLFRVPLRPDELSRFDAAVLDPPRAGAEAQVAELAEAGVPRIAYASCNPVTFARDVARLARAGYALDWVQVVDQFRWSPHVELCAALHRA
ncbi:class I SAM-dependent RNA methyltransferase [Aquicoccus sp. SCR17]|nr:class I SAM-dependent RNA methyltransferase [Carideicomes alvinocaridis]